MLVLTYQSLPAEVKKIANESLGIGVLSYLMSYDHKYHIVLKISNGVLVGFGLYHYNTINIGNGITILTGVIDCICVEKRYRNEGFGTLITFAILRKMAAKKVDRIECVIKKPKKSFYNVEDFWKKLGFRKVKTFSPLDTQAFYDCAYCHDDPDTCDLILYSIDNNRS